MKRNMFFALLLACTLSVATNAYTDSRDAGRKAGESARRAAETAKDFGEGFNESCFIATAVYQSYEAPEVRTLRSFRDRYLETNSVGQRLVRIYYKHGPNWATYIEDHPSTRMPIRMGLDTLVFALRKSGAAE